MYLCIDLKSFYASVECVVAKLDPMTTNLVVADKTRGPGALCLAVSPSLKQLGVRNRCRLYEIPDNIKYLIAKPKMSLYIKYSVLIYKIYLKYLSETDIYPYSIDEMFLDISSYLNYYQMTPYMLAKRILKDIKDTLNITATCGIGTNLYLAKVALDILAKHDPNYIAYLDEKTYIDKLSHHKPLTDFFQIGVGIAKTLNNLGIYDLAGLQTFPLSKLQEVFGINADILYEHAFGRDDTTFLDIRNYQTKSNSLSLSQVLFRDYNYLEARDIIKEMVMSLTLTLIQNRLITKTISLSIVYTKNTFKLFHKQKQIYATNNYQNILTNFLYLYDNFVLKEGYIRQIGISFNQINKEAFKEYNLFTDQKQEEIDYRLFKTINDIKNRYGRNSLLQGINLLEHSTQKIRNTLIGGHHE